MEGKYRRVREALKSSRYTVAFCGTGMMKESGMPSMRAPEIAYEVEKKYGYSPEEIFSSAFYATSPAPLHLEVMLRPGKGQKVSVQPV